MPNIFGLILTCVIVVIVFSLLLFLIKRYKKCPSDKVMVIYGKVGSNKDGSTGGERPPPAVPSASPAARPLSGRSSSPMSSWI